MKPKKSKKHTKSSTTDGPKTTKKSKAELRAAKRAAKKGDGSFPDILVVTKSGEANDSVFDGHPGDDLNGIDIDGTQVAVYKLRRVSTVSVHRKVAR